MGEAGRAILAIVSSVIGLALVATILSQRANTASVINAAGSALTGVIGAATSPVTGGGGAAAYSPSSFMPAGFATLAAGL